MTHRKPSDATSVPERLLIERKVSFDRSSHRSSLSGSNQSLPLEQSSSPALLDAPSQSGSSSGWSASNFDITSLSESEIKKCKKKGINPALFAEMKAARKGKWTSPIAGNTFLWSFAWPTPLEHGSGTTTILLGACNIAALRPTQYI
jgi:hypothetical protein